jgi:hypothetical protein
MDAPLFFICVNASFTVCLLQLLIHDFCVSRVTFNDRSSVSVRAAGHGTVVCAAAFKYVDPACMSQISPPSLCFLFFLSVCAAGFA